MNTATEPLVRVDDMKMHFPVRIGGKKAVVRAVDGVSFTLGRGETLGLVGESGCGKSTTARAVLQLYRPTAGSVHFRDDEISSMGGESLRRYRQHMQMIFQDPYACLNPRMTVKRIIEEPLRVHGTIRDRRQRQQRVLELLEIVGLSPEHGNRYPHEFSGGQRQRIGIARALALNPGFIVCDEPVSALDVSIQAQIINLLEELRDRFNIAYLFISHDLSVVRHISDRVAVMYLGNIVEIAGHAELYAAPQHPYTKALLSSVPMPDPEQEALRQPVPLQGEVGSPLAPPPGCKFHPRCPMATDLCREKVPVLKDHGSAHRVACHHV